MDIISIIEQHSILITAAAAVVSAITTIVLIFLNWKYIRLHNKYVGLIEKERVSKKIQEIYNNVFHFMMIDFDELIDQLEQKNYFKIGYPFDGSVHDYNITILKYGSLSSRFWNNKIVQLNFSYLEELLQKSLAKIKSSLEKCDTQLSELIVALKIPYDAIPAGFHEKVREIYLARYNDRDLNDYILYKFFIYTIAGSEIAYRFESDLSTFEKNFPSLCESLLIDNKMKELIDSTEEKRVRVLSTIKQFGTNIEKLVTDLSNTYQINLELKLEDQRQYVL